MMRDRRSTRAHGIGGGVGADLYPLRQYSSWRSKWTSLLKREAVRTLWIAIECVLLFCFLRGEEGVSLGE